MITSPTVSPIHFQEVTLRVDRNAEAMRDNAKRKQVQNLSVKVMILEHRWHDDRIPPHFLVVWQSKKAKTSKYTKKIRAVSFDVE
jgi:hypothetical protein